MTSNITKTITPKTINGRSYTGEYIPASKACVIAFKLMKIIDGSNNVMPLIESKDDNLMLAIFSHTLRDEMAINDATFDNIYTGNLKELMQALQYIVEVNFADFLQASDIGILGTGASQPDKKAQAQVNAES